MRSALDRLAFFERRCDDHPRPVPGAMLVGDRDLLELALHSSSAGISESESAASEPASEPESESSPRRRRELTVPRGRSSASAISPGVKSSRY